MGNQGRIRPRYGQAGIWVGGRGLHDPKLDGLTLEQNRVSGYRWGIRWIEAVGPVTIVDNRITVEPPCGSVGISAVPFGTPPLVIGWNNLSTDLFRFYPRCPGCKLMSNARVGVEVSLGTIPTPVDVVGNDVVSQVDSIHVFRFTSSNSVSSVRWWCN